jgi:neopullulanase
MRRTILLVSAIVVLLRSGFAGPPSITRVDPPNWWTGMKHNAIQLLCYGNDLRNLSVAVNSRSITVTKVTSYTPTYAFVEITIDPKAAAGNYEFTLTNESGSTSITYGLKKRQPATGRFQGFDATDVIYLITPDRFANGDTTNDSVSGYPDTLHRSDPYGRHGGDLQGIIDHLSYLKDLGVTALWLNPLVENNGREASYHGYAATDLYRIDPRFGSNALYQRFVDEAHARGLKVIMDHVNNHIGINHPWIGNVPAPEWLNGSPEQHQKAFHSKVELTDIHSDSITKDHATLGWFTDAMPDLNQKSPRMARYLIENTLWWIESTGLDGIREDTYPYIDPQFRAAWCAALLREYPHFNIVGEVWIQDPVYLAPYQSGSFFPKSYDPVLPSLTDFGLFDAFARTFSDSGSIMPVFECLTKDFLYPHPGALVTFLDNHDIQRIMFRVKGDARRFALAMTLLLTTRGIPQILYGTEIGMVGGKDHGTLRADFPGGFPGDAHNAFDEMGRTPLQNDLFNLTKELLALRRSHAALSRGELRHFKPVRELYVYFRILGEERILIALNNSDSTRQVRISDFPAETSGATSLQDLRSGETWVIPADSLSVGPRTSRIILLR